MASRRRFASVEGYEARAGFSSSETEDLDSSKAGKAVRLELPKSTLNNPSQGCSNFGRSVREGVDANQFKLESLILAQSERLRRA